MSPYRKAFLVFTVSALCIGSAWAQTKTNEPHIGYLYPAGGQRGQTFQITAGGQFLRGPTEVYVSGEGVHAKVVKSFKPAKNLNGEERKEFLSMLEEASDKILGKPAKVQKNKDNDAKSKEQVKLPAHPLIQDLQSKSLRELAHIRSMVLMRSSKLQSNRQIAESILVEVTIDPNAEPGSRELRIATNVGLTNPMVFEVGSSLEVLELEPNNRQAYPTSAVIFVKTELPEAKPIKLPAVLNGQIMPGDIDRFRFHASKGQKIVIQAHARSLVPYLADAVPGWFQAAMALYDENDKEVAFADDYRFNPDPVLFFNIPKTGEYELEIWDSIYRGRQDFVYRISVGELPFVKQVFPMGAKAGSDTAASIQGWNLSNTTLPLDTTPTGQSVRETRSRESKQVSNSITYAVDTLDETTESESNDTALMAQKITMPTIINGRIDKPGDTDIFKFTGNAGDKVMMEVNARRLNSPLDSMLRLTDTMGETIMLNDDYVVKESYLYKDTTGLVTHHADSYMIAELPKKGTYYVHLTDSQHHGGQSYGYRLRISPPQADFALRVTPSSLTTIAGAATAVNVYVLRKDGFEGEIEVTLKNAPRGFKLEGGRIPAGCDRARMTIATPPKMPNGPVALSMQGQAIVKDQKIIRPASGADDVMQAFLYRHLVPSQQLMLYIRKGGRLPSLKRAGSGPVRIKPGESAIVSFKTSDRNGVGNIKLQLDDPPKGITLGKITPTQTGIEFELKAEKDLSAKGLKKNLIVDIYREFTPKGKNKTNRSYIGVLPAIPVEIL